MMSANFAGTIPAPRGTVLDGLRRTVVESSMEHQQNDADQISEQPTITVLVRTTGTEDLLLAEALASLGAQTTSAFEIIVLLHDPDASRARMVRDQVSSSLHETVRDARVLNVRGGERGRPLNVGIDQASGDYVTFLDDDDLALPNWIEVFQRAAVSSGGACLLRSLTLHRPVARDADGDVQVVGPDHVPDGSERFDLMTVFTRSRTPICSVAVPLQPLRSLHLRFSEDLPALEDFEFLIRAASLLGVHETGEFTSVYRRWQSGEATTDVVGTRGWEQLRREVFRRLDQDPLLLPPGSVTRLVGLHEGLASLKEEVSRLRKAEERLDRIESSTTWRSTRPIRVVMDILRRRR